MYIKTEREIGNTHAYIYIYIYILVCTRAYPCTEQGGAEQSGKELSVTETCNSEQACTEASEAQFCAA